MAKKHAQSLNTGDTQSIIITDNNLPPIFGPGTPNFDIIKEDETTQKLNKSELR